MNQSTSEFISLHLQEDVNELALKYRSLQDVDVALALNQIAGKKKTRYKIPTFYANDALLYPPQLSLEQSSSESTAKYKSTLCEGNKLIDLTGGFGADCYFMSRRFSKSCYVERNPLLCELAQHNFGTALHTNIEVFNADAVAFLNETDEADWIYIDPARRGKTGNKLFLISDCEPDVEALSDLLLKKAPQVMIKLSPMLDINLALAALPHTTALHILSVENDCKELLFILERQASAVVKINAVNFTKKSEYQLFTYLQTEESVCEPVYANEIQTYLYEPNSSVMKAGAFKLAGSRFGLKKLHKNTHLYTSETLIAEFPGRIFQVQQTTGFSKRDIKLLKNTYPKAHINTRNFPLSVAEYRKKSGLTEGGDIYIFACKNQSEELINVVCTKINNEND